MKSAVPKLTLIISILLFTSFTGNSQIAKTFRGTWNFEAPGTPPGFETGVMTITKDSVFTKYPGPSRILPSSSLSFSDGTLAFVFVPSTAVTVKLTAEGKSKLTGMATWSSGESVVTLTRVQAAKTKK